MHNFIFFFSILLATCAIFISIGLYLSYKKLKNKYLSQKKFINSITKTINSVRYGNLHERVNTEAYNTIPKLAQSVNSLINAIVDREDMIKEYQADLNKKIDALQEIEQLKEDFVATLTHDLKVPILAEKNMLNFLLNNRFGELNEKQKEAVSYLTTSNRELVELVEIILETYKLNETKIDLQKEKTDINRLMTETVEQMQPIADTDEIKIEYWSEYFDTIMIDEFYIKRVLKNLILNALSFSTQSSKVNVALCNDTKNIYIKITNYGKSIKKEEIDHVFDKYYTTTKKFRKVGTGLGLYLSDKITKAHDGEIIVETSSSGEQFTTFIVKLPI